MPRAAQVPRRREARVVRERAAEAEDVRRDGDRREEDPQARHEDRAAEKERARGDREKSRPRYPGSPARRPEHDDGAVGLVQEEVHDDHTEDR